MMENQFSLRAVLLWLALLSGVIWAATEYGKTNVNFRILETDLRQVGDGLTSGTMMWAYDDGGDSTSETVLMVDSIDCDRLERVSVGEDFTIRHRASDNLLFARQNPLVLFLIRKLQIRKQDIVGFVELDGQSQVIVRGKAE